MKTRKLPLMLSLLLMLSLFVPAAHATNDERMVIQPKYAGISRLSAVFSISAAGKSSCGSEVKLSNSTYSVELTMELQQKNGNSWETIKTWTTSGSGTVSLDKSWYVTSGSTYRIHTTAAVYNSAGRLVEAPTVDSASQKY